MYVSTRRQEDPRMVANLKLYPLRQTPYAVNVTNFQLHALTSFGSTGVRSWGFPIDFPNDSYNDQVVIMK